MQDSKMQTRANRKKQKKTAEDWPPPDENMPSGMTGIFLISHAGTLLYMTNME